MIFRVAYSQHAFLVANGMLALHLSAGNSLSLELFPYLIPSAPVEKITQINRTVTICLHFV
jgi:hypothetical protein